MFWNQAICIKIVKPEYHALQNLGQRAASVTLGSNPTSTPSQHIHNRFPSLSPHLPIFPRANRLTLRYPHFIGTMEPPMSDTDDDKMMGRIHGEQPEVEDENIFLRLVYMIIIAVMISFAQTILGVLTIIQFVIMLIDNKKKNERIAEFGTDLGVWIAKAARYQTAASDVKPWPWTELD